MNIFSGEIRSEFFKSPMGLAGIGILGILISVSIGAGISSLLKHSKNGITPAIGSRIQKLPCQYG